MVGHMHGSSIWPPATPLGKVKNGMYILHVDVDFHSV